MVISHDKIKTEFKRIKNLGFLICKRPNNKDGGIGNTFEDHLGVIENNKKDPDFAGFEVKSQREFTGSKISLFTKSPTHPKRANRFLTDNFGRPDPSFPEKNCLHASMFGNRWSLIYDTYKMKLKVDRDANKVILIINDINDNAISDTIYWSFEALLKASKKMTSLFVVVASHKKEEGLQYYHYKEASVYLNLDFEKFLTLLENGFIMFDLRMGVYKSGKNIGKPHDHGSGFRIERSKIAQLYEEVIEI